MGIVERTQQVISSNVNALLRRLEEPGKELSLLLDEMKGQILAAQRELLRLIGEMKQIESKERVLGAEIEKWEKRAMLAIRHGDDALAREALQQKRRIGEEQQRLVSSRDEYVQAIAAMKRDVARMRAKQRDKEASSRTTVSLDQSAKMMTGSDGGAASAVADFERWEENLEKEEAAVLATEEVESLLSRSALGTMTNREMESRFTELETSEVSVAGEALIKAEAGENGAIASQANATAEQVEPPRVRVRIEP